MCTGNEVVPTVRRLFLVALAGTVFVACRPAPALEDGGDPAGERNVAAGSDLPRGAGLAEEFPADQGISRHADVRFAEDFEQPGWRDRWDEVRDRDGRVLERVSVDRPELGRYALRVTADLRSNTGGGLTTWFESAPAVFLRYYTRFDAECDYVHHFCTLRGNRGLRGGDRWSGFGGAGERPDGSDRFSTALEPWGNWGRVPPPGTWNFYSYWHEMTAAPDGRFWGNSFRPAEQDPINRGDWICVEFMLKHNTPGQPDGEQAYWIDGQLRGHWKEINWRTSATLQANAFTLESYVTDRWTRRRYNIVDFDNLVIASRYIGPSSRP